MWVPSVVCHLAWTLLLIRASSAGRGTGGKRRGMCGDATIAASPRWIRAGSCEEGKPPHRRTQPPVGPAGRHIRGHWRGGRDGQATMEDLRRRRRLGSDGCCCAGPRRRRSDKCRGWWDGCAACRRPADSRTHGLGAAARSPPRRLSRGASSLSCQCVAPAHRRPRFKPALVTLQAEVGVESRGGGGGPAEEAEGRGDERRPRSFVMAPVKAWIEG